MKKHSFPAILLILAFLLSGVPGPAQAEIIPPYGEGQIGLLAVALRDGVAVRQAPDDAAQAVQILNSRDLVIVTEQSNGWAYCFLGDAEDAASGWVRADGVLVDPAWYRTEKETPVYAWKDTAAPKIALPEANTVFFDPDTFLPILKAEGDWLAVGLRGAAGWIYTGTERQDGERFEETILLEGMEETVRYEHVKNEALGIELDYEYESFDRRSEPDRECFISRYDDPSRPENYLEVQFVPADSNAAAASVSEALSNDYDIIIEPFMLDGAGSCICIDASEARGGRGTPDSLRTIYIIPAADGYVIATAHYTIESAEGFGARMRSMMHTLVIHR